MQIILHIGPHKTGSSYLQRELFNAADVLLNNGVIYPKNNWISGGYGHANIIDGNFIREIKIEIDSIILRNPDAKFVVLSSENFDRLTAEQVLDVKSQLPEDIKIVYYVRRCDKTLYANWQEDIKFGRTESLDNFLLRHLLNPHSSQILNHRIVLDKWINVFGSSSLKIIDYDFLIDSKMDIYSHFLSEFLDLNVSNLPSFSPNKENVSFNIVDCEILRNLYLKKKFLPNLNTPNLTSSFFKVYGRKSVSLDCLRGIFSQFITLIDLSNSSAIAEAYNEFLIDYRSCFITGVSEFKISSIPSLFDGYVFNSQFPSFFNDLLHEIEKG
jgi:hypothetical protein